MNQLISSLGLSERNEARDWLLSPVHNKRKDLVMLFDLLSEYHHELKIELSAPKAFQKLYPGIPFDAQQLRLICSYLLKVLEDWLNWRNWKRDEQKGAPHLLQSYKDRNLEKHFLRQLKTQKKKLDQHRFRNAAYHWEHFQLERITYDWETSISTARGRLYNLQEQQDALQLAFMSYKLQQACYMAAHQRVYKTPYEQPLLSEILELAAQPPYCDEPAIRVYYYCYLTYAGDNPKQAFADFMDELFKSLHFFPEHEASDLLLAGINYCIHGINTEGENFLQEALDLYEKGLENNLLYDDGWLRSFTFNNITSIALRLKKINWTKTFIEQYQKKLEPANRASYVAFSTARIAYAEGDYTTTVRQLHLVDVRDFIVQMTGKVLLLKIYFEEQQMELLSAHIKNTRAFMRRRKNLGYHENNYLNIFSLAEQLSKVNPYNQKQKSILLEKINQTDPLTEKEWLVRVWEDL